MGVLTALVMGLKTVAQPAVGGAFKFAGYPEWGVAAIFFGARVVAMLITFVVARYKYSHFVGILIVAFSLFLFGLGMIIFALTYDAIWLVAIGVAAYGWGGLAISQANATTMGQIAKHGHSYAQANANLTMLNIFKAVGMTAAASAFTWGIHYIGIMESVKWLGIVCIFFSVFLLLRPWGKISVERVPSRGEPESNGGLLHLRNYMIASATFGAWFGVVPPTMAAGLYDAVWVGWVSSALAAGYGICFVAGWWASWAGYRNVVVWSTILMVSGAFMIFLVPSPYALVFGTAIASFGYGAVAVSSHAQIVARSHHTVSTQMWMEKVISAAAVASSASIILVLKFDLQDVWIVASSLALAVTSYVFYSRETYIIARFKK